MKLVINTCYGGFSLSPKAVARLAELRGQKAYFFMGGLGDRPRVEVPCAEAMGMFWSAYNTPTPAEEPSPAEWCSMSQEERIAFNQRQDTERITPRPDDRADPLLVQVVEELGVEANGSCAELRVIEIPDGVDYEIDDYDGVETIHEKHRVWP